MTEKDPSLARIAKMEACLNETADQTARLQEQLDALRALKCRTQELFAYYGSEEWHQDRDADLPAGFRAGVLSEDSVYDAITDLRSAAFGMLKLGTEILEEWL